MRESGSVFGAEVSGHYFHRGLSGGDDGLYTACLLIEHLARGDGTLAQLRRGCPAVYMTPDLRVAMEPARQPKVLDEVRAAWADFPQSSLDGVRIDMPGGWALVRSSVTEAALTFRFEGLDWHALEDLVERFCDALPEVGDELWMRYRAAMGSEG
jgi:phosphomannomutase/phosphoglucomutase